MSLTPSLPQDDPRPEARAAALAQAREDYRPNREKLPSLVMCDGVPLASQPSLSWFVKAGKVAAKVAMNILSNKQAQAQAEGGALSFSDDEAEAIDEELEQYEDMLSALEQLDPETVSPEDGGALSFGPGGVSLSGLSGKVDGQLRALLSGTMAPGLSMFEDNGALYAYADKGAPRRAKSYSDFEGLYRSIPLSPAAADVDDDLAFARRRLTGPNGHYLQRVDRLPDAFPVEDRHLAAATGKGDSLAAAGAEGRLFLADYSGLATALEPKDPSMGMYAYAPYALFALPPGGGALRPVAVQPSPTPGPRSPVLSPADGLRWRMARYVVEVADMAYFEPITHLALTHLMLEAAALATHRHLAPSHPVALLLTPHIEGTISVNDMAVFHLLADGGAIDQTFGATMSSIRGAAAKAISAHDFRGDTVAARFAARGLDDRELMPDNPFRDDTLRVHTAIERWVRAYVHHAYASEAALAADPELASWAAALGARPTEGGLNGFGRVASRADLVEVLTKLIHTASAGHASTNFPQWSDCSFAARMSGSGFTPAEAIAAGTEEALYGLLPPLSKAELHADFLYLLGGMYHTKLGVYESNSWPYRAWFKDPVVSGTLLPAFQRELATIEADISALNADRSQRAAPYEHLLPSRIPQSINI